MSRDKIAVIIPCYNEALTIGKVIDDFRRELPEASVYVYDNNSTDGTAAIARSRGAVVRLEPRQGKGNVCRQMFRDIEADCYLMVDGDDTYPAEAAKALCESILAKQADMVVGDRLSNGTYAKQNGRTFHGFGNDLVRAMIKWIYGYGFEDVMTGYRAMSRPFVKTFPVLSEGFQIETELSIHAVDRRWRIVNIPVKYRDRPEGSVSKLNTVRDGLKVIAMIGTLFKDYRPLKFFSLAARDLGPMYISADILSRRIFIPSHLRQHIEHVVNLAPSDIESLLSECYFDPYALPVETDDMGYRAIGRTGKKSTRELIDELDFTKAGDLSYLDSQFRAIVEPLHDWIFARNLLSILMRIGGLYRSGADPDTILEAARFRQVNPMVLKKRFDIDTGTCYAIPIAFNPIYRMENLADKDISFDALQFCPLYGSLIDKKNSFSRTAIENHLKGPSNEFVKFLAPLEASLVKNRLNNHESHSGENKWRYMVVSSNTDGEAINSQMQLANRLLQAFDGILFQPQLTYTGVKMAEIAPERKPRNILEAMWLLVRNHPGYYLLTCKRCMRTVLSGTQGGERSFCSNSCRATWSKEHSVK